MLSLVFLLYTLYLYCTYMLFLPGSSSRVDALCQMSLLLVSHDPAHLLSDLAL